MRPVRACVPLLALALAACGASDSKTAAPASSSSSSSGSVSTTPPSSTPPRSTPSAAPRSSGPRLTGLPLGTTVDAKGDKGELQVAAVSVQQSTTPLQRYEQPPANGAYLGVLIQYSCTSGSCAYNPFDFTLRSPDGTEYRPGFSGFEPRLNSGTLLPGTKAKGYITYDAAPGSYSLEYRNRALEDDAASWTISGAESPAAPSAGGGAPA